VFLKFAKLWELQTQTPNSQHDAVDQLPTPNRTGRH
jgi:hypothetical protein